MSEDSCNNLQFFRLTNWIHHKLVGPLETNGSQEVEHMDIKSGIASMHFTNM